MLPLLDMITTSFTLAQKDARLAGGAAGDFTLYYWQRLLGSSLTKQMLLQPLLNSLLIGVCVSFFAIMIGSVLAWLMVRTDLPFKPFFSLAVIIPYMIPSWCKSQAWLTMFKTERIGGAPGFLMSLGINVPDWLAYGPVAIISVLSLHYYAYAYLLVSAALNSINSELEEMGEIQGAGKATILRKITLPLVLPSMLSAIILTFSKAIGTFGVINYLGSKVNFVTLSSQLYMNSKSQNTQTAFAMALIMICIASISVFVNQKLIGSRKSYATIGGKGGRSTPLRLGKHKPIITLVLIVFFIFGIIMPIALLILESFMLRQGDYSLSNLTLHYWVGDPIANVMEGQPGIFKNENFINSLINSLKLTFVNGVFGTIFGQIIGYICAKGRVDMRSELKRLHIETGTTMIYVTHDQVEALTMSTKIAIFKEGVIVQVDHPLELYNNPVNLYVADFIGNPSINFADGKAEVGPDGMTVTSPLGKMVFPKKDLTDMLPKEKSFDAVLGIRPEQVSINTTRQSPSDIEAHIYTSMPAGSETLVTVKVGGVSLVIKALGITHYNPDQVVYLSIDLNKINVFDKKSTKLIKYSV